MKALVGAFNQEKALVGAFSVIVQPVVDPMDRFTALIEMHGMNVMKRLSLELTSGQVSLILPAKSRQEDSAPV